VKRLVADLTLDTQVLQDILLTKLEGAPFDENTGVILFWP
jgi:hypothetical protein